jgi:hypothetical protein
VSEQRAPSAESVTRPLASPISIRHWLFAQLVANTHVVRRNSDHDSIRLVRGKLTASISCADVDTGVLRLPRRPARPLWQRDHLLSIPPHPRRCEHTERAGLRKRTKSGVYGPHFDQRMHLSPFSRQVFQRAVLKGASRRHMRAHLRSSLRARRREYPSSADGGGPRPPSLGDVRRQQPHLIPCARDLCPWPAH